MSEETSPHPGRVELPPLAGKIFLTGGAGFLGRAIIRRAQREGWKCSFTVYSRDEEKQFNLQNQYGSHIHCYLGDVRDYQHMITLMPEHDLVIHAAAVKFIPEAERNVWETLKINVDGTRNVIRAAAQSRVPNVISISTDKAALPANVYGMTKALTERAMAEACRWKEPTNYASVRYGNVVGSTGSIVPVFRNQLERKGRLSVTDEKMTRFWLSVDEAIDVIRLALINMGRNPGTVVVPRCGAMKIMDLAKLIAGDAPIDIVGIRPGEKLHEHLIQYQEAPRVERRGDYFLVHPSTSPPRREPSETYTSSNPAYWITPERMSEMIADAEDV